MEHAVFVFIETLRIYLQVKISS